MAAAYSVRDHGEEGRPAAFAQAASGAPQMRPPPWSPSRSGGSGATRIMSHPSCLPCIVAGHGHDLEMAPVNRAVDQDGQIIGVPVSIPARRKRRSPGLPAGADHVEVTLSEVVIDAAAVYP
jgi:hypothetical protein